MTVAKALGAGFLGFILLCAPGPGRAAPEVPAWSAKPPQEQEAPASLPGTTGPIITDTAITQAYKTWSLQVTPTLTWTGGNFSSNWQRRPAGGDYRSLQVPAQLYYGLTPRLDVSVLVPFIHNWAFQVGTASRAAHFGSIGDSTLTIRYMFLNGKPTAPTLTGYFSVLFPTGHASPLNPKLLGIDQTGNGAFAFTWGIDYFSYFPQVPVLFYVNVWYTNSVDGRVNGLRVYYPDQVTVNLALELPFDTSPNNRWALLLEVLSNWDAGRMFGPRANQASLAIVSLLPALEFLPTPWLHLALGVQVDLIGKNTSYTWAPTMACFVNF